MTTTLNPKLSMAERLKQRTAASAPVSNERVLEIPLEKIGFDLSQPRKAFHALDGTVEQRYKDYITELAESIEFKGLIQPITVQEKEDGTYMVVVGECRTRAHLQLGRATIRAIVRNDLTNEAQRLLFQIAENVNREDLSDEELALSIRDLLKGSPTTAPMLQSEIARTLGKSEGWVSRFVKFGDQELQRLWVKTGIVDTVEKLYRVSILPAKIQMNIQRRVNLETNDPEFLAKPLLRDAIDALGREAKILKASKLELVPPVVTPVVVPVPSPGPVNGDVIGASNADMSPVLPNRPVDAVGAMLGAEVVASAAPSVTVTPIPGVALPAATAKYEFSDSDRAALLNQAAVELSTNPGAKTKSLVPSLKCSMSIAQVEKLVDLCSGNEDELFAKLKSVRVDLALPGHLAQLLANRLAGIIVSEAEVPSVVQGQLGKL
jgi:ParB family chromosome partitioning protein